MKMLGESRAIERLGEIREEFREEVSRYEVRAKNCESCDTPGAEGREHSRSADRPDARFPYIRFRIAIQYVLNR